MSTFFRCSIIILFVSAVFGCGGSGNSRPEPTLKSAVATSNTEVALTFIEAMSDSVKIAENYRILSLFDNQELAITKVNINETKNIVTLVSDPQQDIDYQITVSNLQTQSNDDSKNISEYSLGFRGASKGGMDEAPKVVGAISTSNVTVVVNFSTPMGDQAALSSNYSIVQQNVNSEAGALQVVNAGFVGENRKSVLLTTLSQNEVSYLLKVVNVTDIAGQSFQVLGSNTGFNTANNAGFAGTPPNINNFADSDNDGLYDHEEQRGWQSTITLVSGTTVTREVTSDPFVADSDGDGLDDKQELELRSDPRDPDTDDDQFNDAYEYNAVFTDLLKQDTDGDGLSDSLEVDFFRTSPLQVDTDGDQISDSDEVILATRNARIADLPQPSIEIISTDLQVDIRFEESNQAGTRDLETRSVSSTLTQGEEKSSARTQSSTNEVTASVSVEQNYSSSGGASAGFPKFSTTGTIEAGTTHNWSSSWTEESTRSSQEEYARSRITEAEVSEESTVVRRLDGASMKAAVVIGSIGDIAFNINNIQITALVPDIRKPGNYLPVATLIPEAILEDGYTLGPLLPERGPIIFVNREVFPSQVERLMKDPTGVIFKISNYNIIDELGRDFAFTSQDIIDRTTLLSIDFGTRDSDGDGIGDGTEFYRVATSLGIPIGEIVDMIALKEGKTEDEIRTAYGISANDDDSLVAYDPAGAALGVKFHDIMQNIIGFTHYDEDLTPTTSLSSTEQGQSYSTRIQNSIEQIVRIRQTCNNDIATCNDTPGSFRRWATLTADGLLVGGDLSFSTGQVSKPRDDIMLPGKAVTFSYIQDQDLDGIPARLEIMHGCRDDDTDSDDDGLSDRIEVFGAPRDENGFYINPADKWEINIFGRGSYEGFSGCKSLDSDGDGLLDSEEYGGEIFSRNLAGTDIEKKILSSTPTPTFMFRGFNLSNLPSGYDVAANYYAKDEDGTEYSIVRATYIDSILGTYVSVEAEAAAYTSLRDVYVYHRPELVNGSNILLGRLDAKNPDTDEDGVSDYDEIFGYKIDLFFPRDLTSKCVDDTDLDTQPNRVICTSDPLNPDSDGDSLLDGLEIVLGADPSFDDGEDVLDLDNDGLIGREETRGWPVTVNWLNNGVATMTTCDGYRPAPNTIDNNCQVHENKVVESDVLVRDTDGDGLNDRTERDLGIHPGDMDSDNDGRTDFEEVFGYASNDIDPSQIITSNPNNYDTDFDLIGDGDELIAYSAGPITNEDGSNSCQACQSYSVTTNPNGETDTDGLSDSEERSQKTDANKNDTDSDGLSDLNEIRIGSDPLRADQMCVSARFKSVTLTGDTGCDGILNGNGAEFIGLLFLSGEKTVSLPQFLDKDLTLNNTEELPAPSVSSYALVDSTNPVEFFTAVLQECDGISDDGAENKSDGEISGNCKDPGNFGSNATRSVGLDDIFTGATEFKTTIATYFETGGNCKLEFDVEVIQVTDTIAETGDRGLNFFCGGDPAFVDR